MQMFIEIFRSFCGDHRVEAFLVLVERGSKGVLKISDVINGDSIMK